MTSTILADSLTPREEREDGFTLIEILVVIIIIGILAAIAIPIFLNQQRTARDAGTVSDVRNLASTIETGLASDPEPDDIVLGFMNGDKEFSRDSDQTIHHNTPSLPHYAVKVGDAKPLEFTKGKSAPGRPGTVLRLQHTDDGYIIYGWNTNGLQYTAYGSNSSVVYNSAQGGLQ